MRLGSTMPSEPSRKLTKLQSSSRASRPTRSCGCGASPAFGAATSTWRGGDSWLLRAARGRAGGVSGAGALLSVGGLYCAPENLEAARAAALQAKESYTLIGSVYTVLVLA